MDDWFNRKFNDYDIVFYPRGNEVGIVIPNTNPLHKYTNLVLIISKGFGINDGTWYLDDDLLEPYPLSIEEQLTHYNDLIREKAIERYKGQTNEEIP